MPLAVSWTDLHSVILSEVSQTEKEKCCMTSLIRVIKKDRSFTGRTDAEAEAPILWPLDSRNQLSGKDPDGGKD